MSRINTIKSRLQDLFLHDRGNMDEQSSSLLKNDVKRVLSQYFDLHDCDIRLSARDDGEVEIVVQAMGKRARGTK